MQNTIYISGRTTDPHTGQPREGWREDFDAVKKELIARGYDVISPVDVYNGESELQRAEHSRAYWINMDLHLLFAEYSYGKLLGVYVIGSPQHARESYGVMCEVNFALSMGIPVFVRRYGERQANNELLSIKAKGLKNYTRELWRSVPKYKVRPADAPCL